MPFGIEGVITWFWLIKPISYLECKIFGHCFVIFELHKTFCNYTFNVSQAIKIVQIGFEQFQNEGDHCLI
jgi:hypothetical protein